MKKQKEKISLEIDATRIGLGIVSLSEYIKLQEQALNKLHKAKGGRGNLRLAIVDARKTNPLVFDLETETDVPVAEDFIAGTALLESGDEMPPNFTVSMIDDLLAISRSREDVSSASIFINGTKARLGGALNSNLQILHDRLSPAVELQWSAAEQDKDATPSITTVRGFLKGINANPKDPQPTFFLYDTELREIECSFDPSKYEEVRRQIPEHVDGEIRAEVFGEVFRKKSGQIYKVNVISYRFIEPDSKLPTIYDLAKLNLTDGDSTDEFLRRVRDGE